MEINSNTIMCSMLFILLTLSCSGNMDKSEKVETRVPIHFNKVYYWKQNTAYSFLAARFDSTNQIYCTMFSFGKTPLDKNEKKYLVKVVDQASYQIIDTVRQAVEATFSVDSLGAIDFRFSKDTRSSFQMVTDDRYQKLFNELKTKYSFRCIQSHYVSYNRIIGYETKAIDFLTNPLYKNKTESYNDEIYGSGKFHYLDYNGNKFYYTYEGNESIFSKIEIFNNKMESWYLDIKIGDPIGKAMKKLENKSVPFDRQSKSLYVRICNSVSEGTFGHLIFSFDKKLSESSAVLSKITYEPFYDGE